MRRRINNKRKGIFGLNSASEFIIGLLILSVIAIAVFVTLGGLSSDEIVSQLGNTINADIQDETLLNVTETGKDLSVSTLNSVNCVIQTVVNTTGLVSIASGNYTQTNCNLAFTGADVLYNNTAWNVNYTYTYRDSSGFLDVTQNVTEGTSALFAQTTTWMVLLGVVILILIIAVVIAIVKRLGVAGETGL